MDEKDKQDELSGLAGAAGTDVLKGAEMAVDDLETAGITAKDADDSAAEPAAEPAAAEDDEAPTPSPTAEKMAALKQKVDALKEAGATTDTDDGVQAELVQMREMVATLREKVTALEETVAAQQVQVKDFTGPEFRAMPARLASLEVEHEQTMALVTDLGDLVLGVEAGVKEVVIEKNGAGASHDPEGAALRRQMEAMVGEKSGNGSSGDYAVATVFPAE